MTLSNVPEFVRIALLFTTVVAFTATAQSLFSEVSRGRPFWRGFWSAAALDVGLYGALAILLGLLIWSIP